MKSLEMEGQMISFMEEIGEHVIYIMTDIAPIVILSGRIEEIEIALREIAWIGETLGVVLQRIDERNHVVVCQIVQAEAATAVFAGIRAAMLHKWR